MSAKNDVNIIGYATTGDGIYHGIGSISSTDGDVILSGTTTSTNTGHYGIDSVSRPVSAINGSVTFQGSKLDTVSTLANAVANLNGATPRPLYAIADSASMASAQTNGVSWTGAVTANASTGYVLINAKAPSITGAVTAYGVALLANNQSYTLNNASNSIKAFAADIGSGSLNIATTSNLEIGSYGSVNGFTGNGLTITSTATVTQTKPISVSTLTLAGTAGVFDLDQANTVSTSIALNSGTLKVSDAAALGSSSAPITMGTNSILLSNVNTLCLLYTSDAADE